MFFPFEYLVKRRLRKVNMPVLDQLFHVAEEEREQQYPYVRSVYVRIRHDDYLAVAELLNIEILADAAAERLYYRNKRLGRINLVEAGFLDVQNLPRSGSIA